MDKFRALGLSLAFAALAGCAPMNPSSGKPELMIVGGDDKVAIDNGRTNA